MLNPHGKWMSWEEIADIKEEKCEHFEKIQDLEERLEYSRTINSIYYAALVGVASKTRSWGFTGAIHALAKEALVVAEGITARHVLGNK